MTRRPNVGDRIAVTDPEAVHAGRRGVVVALIYNEDDAPVLVEFGEGDQEAYAPEQLERTGPEADEAALRQPPEQTLEDAYQHLTRNRQRAPGRYEACDLAALIILDRLQQTFNAYPFAGERSAS